jgi:hypothetical protein
MKKSRANEPTPTPAPTAEERWSFVRTAVEAADVDPVDVAMAALEMTAAVPDAALFMNGLIELLTSARAAAAIRRGDAPCSCASCTASRGEGPSPDAVYYIPSVVGEA